MSKTILCTLADKYQTDKGGESTMYGGMMGGGCHNYTPTYHELFGSARNDIKMVLEIGINAGGSLRMWKEYFPSALIVGLDNNPWALVHTEDRIMCLLADQNDQASLLNAISKIGDQRGCFNVIIDDGSHVRRHQRVSMETLLPFLSPGGLYVVEDLGRNFPLEVDTLVSLVPDGYKWEVLTCNGGIGGCAGDEWLFVVQRD